MSTGEVFEKRKMLHTNGTFKIKYYCSDGCKIQGLIDEHPDMTTNQEFIQHVKTEHGIDLSNYDKVAGRIIKVR
ncbi:MAG: hypothetical protein MUP55_02870 [Candidatus Aenigmarchaeota archaeon]|nr:hypothetical protein [Candidatus Aenigmarchaeota archaeon]